MVMLGPPCNLSDRHATVGDKLGNDQAMPRDQYCVSVRHQRAFLVERVLSQVPPNQQGPPLPTRSNRNPSTNLYGQYT